MDESETKEPRFRVQFNVQCSHRRHMDESKTKEPQTDGCFRISDLVCRQVSKMVCVCVHVGRQFRCVGRCVCVCTCRKAVQVCRQVCRRVCGCVGRYVGRYVGVYTCRKVCMQEGSLCVCICVPGLSTCRVGYVRVFMYTDSFNVSHVCVYMSTDLFIMCVHLFTRTCST